jgi:hypothetical protein
VSDKTDPAEPRLGVGVQVRASLLIPGSLFVCTGIFGMWLAMLIANLFDPIPWPISNFVDRVVLVVGTLMALLFFMCLRAWLRVRRAAGPGETLVLAARVVPYVMVVGFVGGLAVGIHEVRDDARSMAGIGELTCQGIVSSGTPIDSMQACIPVAIRCFKQPRERVTLYETAEASCVRQALHLPPRTRPYND